MALLKKAIFIDRDGVINEVVDRGDNFSVGGQLVRWTAPYRYDEFKFRPGAVEALKNIQNLDFLKILVTNQPDARYGMAAHSEIDRIMSEVKKLPIDDVFVCFHTREDGCECKKPKPGMLYAAAEKWGINLSDSYFIGDTKNDMIPGKEAGCKTILIDAPYNQETISDFRVANLTEAAELIKNNL